MTVPVPVSTLGRKQPQQHQSHNQESSSDLNTGRLLEVMSEILRNNQA